MLRTPSLKYYPLLGIGVPADRAAGSFKTIGTGAG
jgi:hypothetical protein